MWRLYFAVPWALPAAHAGFCALGFLAALILEARFKPNALRFFLLYTLTIPPAIKGDLFPYFVILSTPE